MDGLLHLIIWCGVGGLGVCLAASVWNWWMEPTRRALRRLAQLLGGTVDVAATAPGRGQGVGVRIEPAGIAVVASPRDQGLVFAFEELAGVELIANGDVRARAFVGEARLPLDSRRLKLDQASVRLVFEDVRHPEFELLLIEPEDPAETRDKGYAAALRLYAHLETVVRRRKPSDRAERGMGPEPTATVAGFQPDFDED